MSDEPAPPAGAVSDTTSAATAPLLFTPMRLRGLTSRNRIVIAPMLQYSSAGAGLANDWHLVHLGRLALGGAGIVLSEAIAVEERGRITHGDLGLWSDAQVPMLRRIVAFVKGQGAIAGVQLAHAGRKAGTQRPWEGHGPLTEADLARGEPPWAPLGPSALPASPLRPVPQEMTSGDFATIAAAWRTAALRALDAGFELVEIHGAHGYLLHTLLSPSSNRRTDRYGGDAAGRMRFPLEIAEVVRRVWPADRPVFYRVSAVDEAGWTIEDTVEFARELKARGIDVVDCSSGSLHDSSTANVRLRRGLGFQVPFAERVRHEAGIATMAVGLILDPRQAEDILAAGRADLVAIGREALFDPSWPLHAQAVLDPQERYDDWPRQHGWWLEKRAQILRSIRGGSAPE